MLTPWMYGFIMGSIITVIVVIVLYEWKAKK